MSDVKTIYLKDYQPPFFFIDRVDLHIDITDEKTTVTAQLAVRRNKNAVKPEIDLRLDGEELSLQRMSLDGVELSVDEYQCDEHGLIVYGVPDEFILQTEVVIKPQENTCLMGLYQAGNNFCTQCEAEGFRRITYFIDRPDILSVFSTKITAEKARFPTLLSNGNLISARDLEDGRHEVQWQDPSLKPCYLFAVVAGSFDEIEDEFITCSGRSVRLAFYLEKGFKNEGYFAVESLKRAMRWDEDTYGREYDLDIYMVVAVSDFTMGAMENKGLNVFNTKYVLANANTATDQDYIGIEGVIGHEYFHNWSGNRVTCRDWFQLTLKEGLTVFRDQTFSEDMTSSAVVRIPEINFLRQSQFAEDAGPLAHPILPKSYIEINNFYTATVYRKGAEVIRMIRTLVTPAVFRLAMDAYFAEFDGQAVTTDDFLNTMESVSGKDLSQFRLWYDQAGTPVLDVSGEFDKDSQSYCLTVQQHCPATPGQSEKLPFYIPLAVGLLDASGKDIALQLDGEDESSATTMILEVTQAEQTFTFINIAEPPVPSLLRHFSAPVHVNFAYADAELAYLLRHDSDPIARWDAGQQLMLRLIVQRAKLADDEVSAELYQELINSLQYIMGEWPEDDMLFARMMQLPSISLLLSHADQIDIASLVVAHTHIKQVIAKTLESEWLAIYDKFNRDVPYEYTVEAMGYRAVKNVALFYLLSLDDELYTEKAVLQFNHTDNMTDKMASLSALNQVASSHREAVLDDFYQQYHAEPLVVNKWLAMQALAQGDDTLAKVEKLMSHEAFSVKNPNNVYALLGEFAQNVGCFHSKDGSGYRFIADQVIALDDINPQVAVRLVQPLVRWRQLDALRGDLMKEQLTRISEKPKLSSDMYEVVTKGLL